MNEINNKCGLSKIMTKKNTKAVKTEIREVGLPKNLLGVVALTKEEVAAGESKRSSGVG